MQLISFASILTFR